MKRIISFSIWGNDPLYWAGMIENLKLARELYRDWTCRIYHDLLVPVEARKEMQNAGAELRPMGEADGWNGLFWRFLPGTECGIDAFIVRDADSRLNFREQAAVNEWLASDYAMHVMRDHHEHNVPMMGGMWGYRGRIKNFAHNLKAWPVKNIKGSDQRFLAAWVWPRHRDHALVHDRYYSGLIITPDSQFFDPFATVRDSNGEHRQLIQKQKVYPAIEMGYGATPARVFSTPAGSFLHNDVYCYTPEAFGEHDCRPFPHHKPCEHHVGEIVRC